MQEVRYALSLEKWAMSEDTLPWYKTFFGADYLQMYIFLTPQRADLSIQTCYGGLEGSRLTLDSPRLVVIGAKAEDEPTPGLWLRSMDEERTRAILH